MAIQKQTFTLKDPGVGTVAAALSVALVLGFSTLGTADVMQTYSSIPQLVAAEGEGNAVELAAHILQISGGPVRFLKTQTSVAGSVGSVTVTRASTSTGTLGFATTPNDDYSILLEIMSTGTVGVGTFRYSLDGGNTFSETLTIPSGGTYVIPNSGLTATFTPGAGAIFFEVGDTFEAECVAPMFNAADLSAAFTAILADSTSFDFIAFAGRVATGAAAATLGAAIDTHMANLFNRNRFRRAMMDAGNEAAATVKTAWAATSSKRLAVCFGKCTVASAKPFAGWAAPSVPIVHVLAARAAGVLISTDLARAGNTNPLPGVTAITHDEGVLQTMDDAKFSTLRTWEGSEGFFVEACRLKSPAGSDFEFWQHGRLMDATCKVVFDAQSQFHSVELRTKGDGTIDEADAARIEKEVDPKIEDVIGNGRRNKGPKNASGTAGHCSDYAYRVSRTERIQTTKTLVTEVAVRPLAYPKFISTTLGFAVNVAA